MRALVAIVLLGCSSEAPGSSGEIAALPTDAGFAPPSDVGSVEAAPPLVFVDFHPPAARAGVLYDYLFRAEGGAKLRYVVSEGALPTDLSLTPEGRLTGTPPASAALLSFTFTVKAIDGPRDATTSVTMVVSPGYRANVLPIVTSAKYGCQSCHAGNTPNFSEAKALIGAASGGKPAAVASQCEGRVYVVPGKPDESLVLQKIAGPAPCGVCMPQGAACGTVSEAERKLIAGWISSLPATPTGGDLQ